ncbi:MAG: hypothetical protein H3C51_03855 [Rubellimicrobium sp.]|nr:hypothetical protein [Rubellimicrobium sp.]
MDDGLFGRERFVCAPGLRIEAQEKMAALQFAQLNARLERIEEAMERLERRLWVAVYGVAAAMLAQMAQSALIAGGMGG